MIFSLNLCPILWGNPRAGIRHRDPSLLFLLSRGCSLEAGGATRFKKNEGDSGNNGMSYRPPVTVLTL